MIRVTLTDTQVKAIIEALEQEKARMMWFTDAYNATETQKQRRADNENALETIRAFKNLAQF